MAPRTDYRKYGSGNEAPAREAVSATVSDTADLDVTSRPLYIGVSGDVKVNMIGQTTGVTFKAVPVGILPVMVDRVYLTGTTATDIVALW